MAATREGAGELFGRKCRLPVALWILQHDKRFKQSEPPTFGTTCRSNITTELERLVRADMLREERPGPGAVYYEMADNDLWRVVELAGEVIGMYWDDGQLRERR